MASLWLVVMVAEAATVKVGVLLPLKEKSERGTTMVEFYQGLLMAIENVKDEGTNVEVYTHDCGTSATSLQHVLATDVALASLDVIFGPLDTEQVMPLAEFCRQHSIRMVLPFNTPCPQLYGNPWMYLAGTAQEMLYPSICSQVIANLENSNFVMVDCGNSDERGEEFTSHLQQVLTLRRMQVTEMPLNGGEAAYEKSLNQFRNNVLIPDSRDLTSLTHLVEGTKIFLTKYPEYKVTLMGYPDWLPYARQFINDFYQLDTYLFSPYYRNPLSGRVARFEQRYGMNYGKHSRDGFPRAEMLGYDLGYYFLHGLATLGDRFEMEQGSLRYQPVQHAFSFQRVGEQGGFINMNVQLVHYSTNKTVQVIGN